jgi:hypothetical protein
VKTIVLRSIVGLILFFAIWIYATAPFARWFDGFYTVRVASMPVRPITTNWNADYKLADWPIPVPASIPGIKYFLDEANDISFTKERSILAWPTPFEINFIGGHSASWRRYTYYRLIAKRPSGERIELIWRYIQPYSPPDGWVGEQIGDSTGLIQIVQH